MENMTSGPLFQNVRKSLDHAAKVINCDPNVLVRLQQPKRSLIFSIPVRMDDYKVKVFAGYRVQYSSSLGPFKGGIRYHQEVNLSEVAGLAALMTFKTSLLNLPLGGAKGGVRVDPTILSRTEKQNLTRRFTTELGPFIGPQADIPAPDMGTDSQTMAWMMDTYSQQAGYAQPGVVTGKPIDIGGSLGRESSTGHGVIYAAEKACETKQMKMSESTVAVQGFGNVGRHASDMAIRLGAKVVAVSDVSGGIFNGDGLNIPELFQYVEENKVVSGFPGSQSITNSELIELEVDILAPCALDGVINENNVDNIKAKIIVEGDVHRISPEAPVPVVEVHKVQKMLGLSANVAANISSLGGHPILVSVIGEDPEGSCLKSLMSEKGISPEHMMVDANRPTTAKTRVMSGQHHIVRVDYENKAHIGDDLLSKFEPSINHLMDHCDGVIIQDYAKGMINRKSAQMVIQKAKKTNRLVIVDPYRSSPLDYYQGADIMTPNRDEASELARQIPAFADWNDVDSVGKALMNEIQSEKMVVTLGGQGMKIFSNDSAIHLPTFARKVFDVTGAGDTVVSALTLALSAGWSMEMAGYFANLAAGVVVGQVGAVACTTKDLKTYIHSHF